MSRITRKNLTLLALVVALVATLAAATGAQAATGYSSKVDPYVVQAADAQPGGSVPVVVEPATGVLLSTLGSLVQSLGGVVGVNLAAGGLSAIVPVSQLSALGSSLLVGYVAPDLPLEPMGSGYTAASTLTAVDYPSQDDATRAWSAGYDGHGVGVAVIDSGVAPVSDFGTRLVQVKRQGQTSVPDSYGHGTFVAGVVAGSSSHYTGVAPGATVYALKVDHADGSAPRTSDIVDALDWVSANAHSLNIRVVDLSLQELTPSSYHGSLLDAAVEHAWKSGLVVVASAGNLGPGSEFFAPANDPFVISVGALDVDGQTPTAFSSSGTTPDGYARPDIYAPGRHITSALPEDSVLAGKIPLQNVVSPGYAMANGTSFAAPQVAAAAAILLEKYPSLSPDKVKWLLIHTGRPVSADAPALDVYAALSYSGSVASANGGLALGNCTTSALLGFLSPCYAPGGAYLLLYDELKAQAADQKAMSAAASFNSQATSDSQSGWTGATWNGSTWNGSTWNAATWNAATWNAATWNAATWNADQTWG